MNAAPLPWRKTDAAVALAFAVSVAVSAFSGATGGESCAAPDFASLLIGTSLLPALVVFLGAVRCAQDRVHPAELAGASGTGMRTILRWIGGGALAGLAVAAGCGALAMALQSAMEALGLPAPPQNSVQWLLAPETPWRTRALLVVHAAAVAPVCEEILYRGILLSGALRWMPHRPWAAAAAVSLLFGAAHGSLVALLPLGLVGVVCAALFLRTGSLLPSMALHMVFNAANLALVALAG